MALWVCGKCTAAYAVGLPACPQCGSTQYEEEHDVKISRGGGATYGPEDGATGEDGTAEAAGPVPVADQLAAGIPPGETVTIADQKAGADPPAIPAAGEAEAPPKPPPSSKAPPPPKKAGNGG